MQVTEEDIRAFAVLCTLAGKHPDTLSRVGLEHDVKPEWLLGLQGKFEEEHERLQLRRAVWEGLDNALGNGYEGVRDDEPEHVAEDIGEYDADVQRIMDSGTVTRAELIAEIAAWQATKGAK